ncbi:hypothetical protein L6452_16140 [Arctium lappa]|uniref:Uncharacterized protein n=1 Tax=Arctium lappa TaxID=4217 RepID=A0ACB9BZZ2_ARCLA|nr:hypothetical protein L6452_16140 [Arctium lappa]
MLQPSPFGHAGNPLMGSSPFGHAGNPLMGVSPFGHAGNPFMGVNSFGSSLYGPNGSPFMDAHAPRIHEHRQSLPDTSRGPIIEELNSDEEKEEPEAGHSKKENPHKHGRSARQPYVEQPDDRTKGRELKQTQYGNQFSIMHDTHSRPQAHSFTFESSTVTYGGSNGAYYSSSTTRRAGSDGLRFEEHKEADSVRGQAAHRISRGIYDKGHTVSRLLKSDGEVDTMQMLHNINEDELAGFEKTWKGKATKHLPGWTDGTNSHVGVEGASRGGWALPSSENTRADAGGRRRAGAAESFRRR